MKKIIFLMLTAMSLPWMVTAQSYDDDLYYVPKKEKDKAEEKEVVVPVKEKKEVNATVYAAPGSTVVIQERTNAVRDVDEYNRRYDAKDNEFAMKDDTLYISKKPANALNGEWIGGFEGSQDDYEYAERIIRFRNPRYAIPISSPYYWDVVYGLNSWDWNVYSDGYYAYAFPTFSNRLWWDWRWGSHGWGFGPGWNYGWGWGYNSWYTNNYWGWGGHWPGYWYGGWGGYHHHWGGGYWYPGSGSHWASTPVYHNTRRSEFAGSSNRGTVSSRRSDYNGTTARAGSTTTSARRSAPGQAVTRDGATSSRRIVGARTSETTRPSGSVMTRPSTGISSGSSSYNSRNSSGSTPSATNSGSNSSSSRRSSYTPSSSSRSSSSSYSSGSSSSSRSSGSVSSGSSSSSSRSSGGGSSRR
jgi:hypothetical protein